MAWLAEISYKDLNLTVIVSFNVSFSSSRIIWKEGLNEGFSRPGWSVSVSGVGCLDYLNGCEETQPPRSGTKPPGLDSGFWRR